jgi:uncharacterized membrane protein
MTSPKQIAIVYMTTLLAFLAIDAVWLSQVAIPQFAAALGDMLRPQPDATAAIAFYLMYPAGVVYLAVRPGLMERSAARAAINGAVLGLTAYGTYELTNLAVLKGWPPGLAMLDIAWGTVLTSVAATIGCWAGLCQRS